MRNTTGLKINRQHRCSAAEAAATAAAEAAAVVQQRNAAQQQPQTPGETKTRSVSVNAFNLCWQL